MIDETPTTPVEPAVLSTDERTRLAQAYQAGASRVPDLLEANLRVVTAELFLFVDRLGTKARQQFDAGDDDGEYSKLATISNLYFKALQQTYQYAKFERRPAVPRPNPRQSPSADGSD
jgi:hypothetical protein